MKKKISKALHFLSKGQPCIIDRLRLEIYKNEIIKVIGWSKYKNFTNLTKQQCRKELEEIKIDFNQIVENSVEFKDFIQNKSIEFSLYFDDYGKGSIEICIEKNGIIKCYLS